MDEVAVKIAGRSYWHWRAVDQHGVVFEEILQPKRDKRAAKRLLVKLMKCWGFVPERIIADTLRSYWATKRETAPGLDHWSHKGHNNRAETAISHFENARERCRAIDHLEDYSVLCQSIPHLETVSLSLPVAAPLSLSAITDWKHSTLRKQLLASPH